MTDDIPDTGAVFTFGRSHFADNEPSHFFIKNDPIVAISCGDEHSAVICQNGRVFVFGSNAWGQLGLGHKDEVTRPSCVKWLKPHRVMFVACGRAHTVFVTDTNAIYTVGCNDEGQLGTGDMEHHTVPQYVELEGDNSMVRQVSAGSNHTAILTDDGRVFVCGSNSEGQLGLGEDTRSALNFTELKFVEKIAFVECGYYHTVFITSKGGVFVTGDNENQKLGIPSSNTTVYAPECLSTSVPIKSACCGASHTFLLSMDESQILAFGSNEKGQLGMGSDMENVTKPTEIDMEKMFEGYQLKLVACGAMHTAFVTDNGLLYTCGESRHNKLCLDDIDADNSNDAPNQYFPKRVSGINGFIVDNVACGGCHTLITATKGSNADFTNNDFNIIKETNTTKTELPPLKVPMNNDFTIEDLKNSNIEADTDKVNGNEENGSIDSLEANVSGSHIVNINDLDGSTNDIPNLNKDETAFESSIENVGKALNSTADKITESVSSTVQNVTGKVSETVKDAKETLTGVIQNTKENVTDAVQDTKEKVLEAAEDAGEKISETAKDVKGKINEKVGVAGDMLQKTFDMDTDKDDGKILRISLKDDEVTNSPPPKSPIIQDLLHVPDISQMSPELSRRSEDGQKSEGGSENDTIPCASDKSSPQAKTRSQAAVMPIVRSEDNLDGDEVVVNKMPEKGRFARMFQSIKDKENSCISKGKVIEENVVETMHKGVNDAEEKVHRVEETIQTEIRNQTNSRTCSIL